THAATNANVTGATLTLTVESFSANPTIRGYYVSAPWSTAPGTDLGWLRTGGGQNWTIPGALGQGTDVVWGKSFVVPGITGNGTQTITLNLDPIVVQNWIDDPNANQGILLVNETTGAVVRIDASENATATLRPKLSVSYTVSSAPLLGDYKGNNTFDAADYTMWRKTLGQTGLPPFSGADGDGDGTVDSDDYYTWRARFGDVHTIAAADAIGSLSAPVTVIDNGTPPGTFTDV